MRFVRLNSEHKVPALGLGTWRMGETKRARAAEVAAVQAALEIGYRLIDTAEMYGDGGAEEVVGAAIEQTVRTGTVAREDLTIVSKVLPSNASHAGVLRACERSLKRLRLDVIDVYLLHWPGLAPLKDTVAAFEQLRTEGRIRHWGVSNFDTTDMKRLWSLPAGSKCVTNQVYYSASERGTEFDLIPWQRDNGVAMMAYSPIDQGALTRDSTFATVGKRHGVSASTAALAWVLRQPGMIAIPMSGSEPHLRENFRAVDYELSAEDLAQIDAQFPPPRRKRALATT
ncbi:MAG TPA: aldo/keto reductase [Burkholderiaceae bacterium]|nr:aldo/keto reductase [Burkholderiaceae bacterium]